MRRCGESLPRPDWVKHMKTQNHSNSHHPRGAPDKVGPDDPRYADLLRRGFNKRFAGRPDYVRLVGSTEQVVDAVHDAVRDKLRVAVRSGGHCLEGLVADPAVRVVIDTSLMTDVYYDPEMGAFAIEAGATLGEAYRKLFLGWGVTIPAGESPDIGVGGHVLGGGFGFLCRQHGLAADHLYGVEVVVVDEAGTARSVVATREPSDPNRDLWWAHTGGGGGNFGVVTRYWFRSPGASGTDPAWLLPKAPDSVLAFRAAWNWDDIDEAAFTRLVRNFGDWCERNSDADSPYAKLYSMLFLAAPPVRQTRDERAVDRRGRGRAAVRRAPGRDQRWRRRAPHPRRRENAPGWPLPSIPSPSCSRRARRTRSSRSRTLSCASDSRIARSTSPTTT